MFIKNLRCLHCSATLNCSDSFPPWNSRFLKRVVDLGYFAEGHVWGSRGVHNGRRFHVDRNSKRSVGLPIRKTKNEETHGGMNSKYLPRDIPTKPKVSNARGAKINCESATPEWLRTLQAPPLWKSAGRTRGLAYRVWGGQLKGKSYGSMGMNGSDTKAG